MPVKRLMDKTFFIASPSTLWKRVASVATASGLRQWGGYSVPTPKMDKPSWPKLLGDDIPADLWYATSFSNSWHGSVKLGAFRCFVWYAASDHKAKAGMGWVEALLGEHVPPRSTSMLMIDPSREWWFSNTGFASKSRFSVHGQSGPGRRPSRVVLCVLPTVR